MASTSPSKHGEKSAELNSRVPQSKSIFDMFRRRNSTPSELPTDVRAQHPDALDAEQTPVDQKNSEKLIDLDEKNMANADLKHTDTDASLPEAPLENFRPQRIFHFVKHHGFSSDIRVNDVTPHVDMSTYQHSDEWNKPVRDAAVKREETDPPYLLVHKHKWYGLSFTAYWPQRDSGEPIDVGSGKGKSRASDLQGDKFMDWKGGFASSSSNTLTTSTPYSRICDHPIKMECDSYWKFRDAFVVASAKYTWRCLNTWSERSFALERTIAGRKTLIAQFWGPTWQMSQGGILVVDESQIDPALAVMTCLVMLRKQRQRVAEHSA